MKKFLLAAVLLVLMFTIGCISAPIIPPMGMLYDNVSAPIDIDYDETIMSMKKGEATCTSIIGLVAFGDCSTKAAAQNGGLKKVNYADYTYKNYVGILQYFTVKVYGD